MSADLDDCELGLATAIINYHRRYHGRRLVSTSRAERCDDEIANARMDKKPRMRWSPTGAHRVALIRSLSRRRSATPTTSARRMTAATSWCSPPTATWGRPQAADCDGAAKCIRLGMSQWGPPDRCMSGRAASSRPSRNLGEINGGVLLAHRRSGRRGSNRRPQPWQGCTPSGGEAPVDFIAAHIRARPPSLDHAVRCTPSWTPVISKSLLFPQAQPPPAARQSRYESALPRL
jgi:hypothetical protein